MMPIAQHTFTVTRHTKHKTTATIEKIGTACRLLTYKIVELDGDEVLAQCEACAKPITREKDRKSDGEGIEFCAKCWQEMIDAAAPEALAGKGIK